jgi:hypothetical protein
VVELAFRICRYHIGFGDKVLVMARNQSLQFGELLVPVVMPLILDYLAEPALFTDGEEGGWSRVDLLSISKSFLSKLAVVWRTFDS